MSGKIVLDSSVVVALFFKEEASGKAEEIVGKHSERYTVSQVYPEVANAAWKRVKFYGEDAELVRQALDSAIEFIDGVCEVVDARELLDRAFDLSLEYGVTVYDALFVALAAKLSAKLVTLDRKLYEKLEGTKLKGLVHLVG